MVSMPIVMKIMSGCCRTVDTPLQRSNMQQHVVLVLSPVPVILQAFIPPKHAASDALARITATASSILNVNF
jgi:hypothetical protein